MGFGVLGLGDGPHTQIPNPQSPIPMLNNQKKYKYKNIYKTF